MRLQGNNTNEIMLICLPLFIHFLMELALLSPGERHFPMCVYLQHQFAASNLITAQS